MYKTKNPIGSTQLKDLSDNSGVFDRVVNSEELETPTRLDKNIATLAGIKKTALDKATTEVNTFINSSSKALEDALTEVKQSATEAQKSADEALKRMTEIEKGGVISVNDETGAVSITPENIGGVNLKDTAYFTINFNNKFTLYSTTTLGNPSPFSMGWGNGLDGLFETEIIPVLSGVEPSTRPEIAKELLDFMGIGRETLNFSESFNIFRIKNVSGDNNKNPNQPWAFHIPGQHIPIENYTYMVYCRGAGFNQGADETFNGTNRMEWRLYRRALKFSSTGDYQHIDVYCTSSTAEIWLALPSVIVGIYPEGRKLPVLFNVTDNVISTHYDNFTWLHAR